MVVCQPENRKYGCHNYRKGNALYYANIPLLFHYADVIGYSSHWKKKKKKKATKPCHVNIVR